MCMSLPYCSALDLKRRGLAEMTHAPPISINSGEDLNPIRTKELQQAWILVCSSSKLVIDTVCAENHAQHPPVLNQLHRINIEAIPSLAPSLDAPFDPGHLASEASSDLPSLGISYLRPSQNTQCIRQHR
jgi:hypothetical protein